MWFIFVKFELFWKGLLKLIFNFLIITELFIKCYRKYEKIISRSSNTFDRFYNTLYYLQIPIYVVTHLTLIVTSRNPVSYHGWIVISSSLANSSRIQLSAKHLIFFFILTHIVIKPSTSAPTITTITLIKKTANGKKFCFRNWWNS